MMARCQAQNRRAAQAARLHGSRMRVHGPKRGSKPKISRNAPPVAPRGALSIRKSRPERRAAWPRAAEAPPVSRSASRSVRQPGRLTGG